MSLFFVCGFSVFAPEVNNPPLPLPRFDIFPPVVVAFCIPATRVAPPCRVGGRRAWGVAPRPRNFAHQCIEVRRQVKAPRSEVLAGDLPGHPILLVGLQNYLGCIPLPSLPRPQPFHGLPVPIGRNASTRRPARSPHGGPQPSTAFPAAAP